MGNKKWVGKGQVFIIMLLVPFSGLLIYAYYLFQDKIISHKLSYPSKSELFDWTKVLTWLLPISPPDHTVFFLPSSTSIHYPQPQFPQSTTMSTKTLSWHPQFKNKNATKRTLAEWCHLVETDLNWHIASASPVSTLKISCLWLCPFIFLPITEPVLI